ncbi:MAG: hypothetical protein IPM25_09175 [Chloracidobacterium sp.]|nr:hypothetical protein [Chloracidobacterium sp.]
MEGGVDENTAKIWSESVIRYETFVDMFSERCFDQAADHAAQPTAKGIPADGMPKAEIAICSLITDETANSTGTYPARS